MLRVIVLDFDGVVVDSNRLKYEAFLDLFPLAAQPIAERVLAHHREESRFEIVRRFLVALGEAPVQEVVARLAQAYDARVQRNIVAQGVSIEVRKTLEWLAGRCSLYLNSGTPEASLRTTARALDVEKFFRELRGTPCTKEENLRHYMLIEHATAADVLVVGDGEADYQAAQAIGLPFVGVTNEFNRWTGASFPVLPHLSALPEFLKSRL